MNYKGDSATDRAKRRRAQVMYKLDKCEMCDDKATDRHHIDGIVGHNKRSNLLFLCRRCHMLIDGRMEKLTSLERPRHSPKKCKICGELAKPLRKGLCSKCNEYFRRNGRHRPKLIQGSFKLTEKMLNLIIKLRNQKLSYEKIQNITGISAATVRTHCLSNGCKLNLNEKKYRTKT